MKYRIPTESDFLEDVKGHTLKIIHNCGLHRHLLFDNNGSSSYHFNIVTFPGYLCYTGDMGAFTFSRVQDMFQFFRSRPGGPLRINPGYWAEKLVSESKPEGSIEFDPDLVRPALMYDLETRNLHESKTLIDAIDSTIIPRLEDGEDAVRIAIRDFEHENICFDDFWEVQFKSYTHHFIWCCWALVWGIREFDAAIEGEKNATR